MVLSRRSIILAIIVATAGKIMAGLYPNVVATWVAALFGGQAFVEWLPHSLVATVYTKNITVAGNFPFVEQSGNVYAGIPGRGVPPKGIIAKLRATMNPTPPNSNWQILMRNNGVDAHILSLTGISGQAWSPYGELTVPVLIPVGTTTIQVEGTLQGTFQGGTVALDRFGVLY